MAMERVLEDDLLLGPADSCRERADVLPHTDKEGTECAIHGKKHNNAIVLRHRC